ncbi:hypothetical protein AEQ48_20430 [Pseudomonas libanensis]|uniref:Uncharacterized protein n=1 Tax=Pseudomonas libanensis TaxID=75588 RepID=A0ABR5M3Z2_9PSED|nr:hypothetical protein AEQ48_20430 [Pseudomonas libanensis]
MSGIDDFRFKSHHLLIELDAATSEMMMLVSSKELVGPKWEAAAKRHHDAFQAWNDFVNSSTAPAARVDLPSVPGEPGTP